MIRFAGALAALALAGACENDETLRNYGAADKIWRLTELNGAPFAASATLQFPETGQATGAAPCNGFSASMTVPYPWFELGPVMATRRACPDLEAETAYFDALATARQAEVLGNTMILSNTDGLSMVFIADD